MGKFFDLDSPLMRGLSKMADLLWLNFLTLILCIPIVTAGAAITALNYCTLKLVRGTESYITKDYFRSFKSNFVQSTIIWIISLVVGIILGSDFYIISKAESATNNIVNAALFVSTILFLFTVVAVFPIQSHFENPVIKTIKNAFVFSISVLPRSFVIIISWLIPPIVFYFVGPLSLIGLLFCFSFPTYVTALLYNKIYKKYEPEEKAENDDFTWSVNSDLEEGENNDLEEEE